eukprot:s1006_g6.t1
MSSLSTVVGRSLQYETVDISVPEQVAECRRAIDALPANNAVFEVANYLDKLVMENRRASDVAECCEQTPLRQRDGVQPAVIGATEMSEPTDGSRLQGQIKEVHQDGGLIVYVLKELSFTPTDLPANLQRQVLSGETSRLQRATVLFTLALGGARAFAKEVMIIPEPDEIIVGEVVQFNASAGYGFIKPTVDSVFQQDDLSRALSDEERGGLSGQTCRFNLRLTPDNRPQARRVELVGAAFGAASTRFSYEPPVQAAAAPAGFSAGGMTMGVPEEFGGAAPARDTQTKTRFSYEAPNPTSAVSGFHSGAPPEPTFEKTSRFSATPPPGHDVKRAAEGNAEEPPSKRQA